jgi:hypothetical protein
MSVHSNLKYVDVFRNPKWLLDNLLSKYKLIRVPTNNWNFTATGSGHVWVQPGYIRVGTGTVANSSELGYTDVLGLNSGDIILFATDWTKYLELHFFISRFNSDPEVVARFQLKESNALGPLSQRGIGIEINNYRLVGEGYGTARGTVDLDTTLADSRVYWVKLILRRGILEFWVNNVFKGALSEVYAPNVKGTAFTYLVVSINNGATGGVDARFYVGNINIIQEW